MSLVAYGASDDSETSDVEESETGEAGNIDDRDLADHGKISDEEDYVPTAKIQSAEPSTSLSTDSVISVGHGGFNSVHTPSALSDLPPPKAASPAAGAGEDELEEEVKPKAAQLADAPRPPPRKARPPTRIVLPALKKDSDDEEEESQKKPKQPATATTGASQGSRSGLFSVLPPPSHMTRKQSNRPLIPYTLTKRPPAPKPTRRPASTTPSPTPAITTDADALPSQKHQSAFNALTGYESDSDEDDEGKGGGATTSNFFSIGSEASGTSSPGLLVVKKKSAPSLDGGEGSGMRTGEGETSGSSDSTRVQPSHSRLQLKPVKTVPQSLVSSSFSSSSTVLASTSNASENVVTAKASENVAAEKTGVASLVGGEGESGSESEGEEIEASSMVGMPRVDQDAPLTFSSAAQGGGSWATSTLTSPMMMPEMFAAPMTSGGGGAADYWQRQQHFAQDYAQEEQEVGGSGGDFHQYMEDEQFLRISGKRKRGQEDFQIIDANVDDHVDPSDLMKGLSEESSYQPHRKKENMPSTQQRRKKQITYLAFQAKERELELKNAWSQNRMTKNQARSKYGF
ncbi:hypothetical protein ACOMHN_047136 [Nucella lapillus]